MGLLKLPRRLSNGLNLMKIDFHKNFKKKYRKLKFSEQRKFDERLLLFEKEPFNHILNNHFLSGEYLGYRSINITGDIRAHYEEVGLDSVLFINIGTHSELYG